MDRKLKHKLWHDYRSQKYANKKSRRKIGHNTYSSSSSSLPVPTSISTTTNFQNVKKVPSNFSFLNNPEETIDYFDDLVYEIKQKGFKSHFFIDSKHIESVTVDALIYLISIMQNVKRIRLMKHSISGNLPLNESIKQIYIESGFMSYVQSNLPRLPSSTAKMKIVSGTNNEPTVASTFCKFVGNRLNKTKRETRPLYAVLVELLSNVYYHAYNDENTMLKHWYIYAEHIGSRVRFVFVDTGAGIPQTVSITWQEKIARLFKTATATDADLIDSALMGEFRTQTQETHRGNGLDSVRINVQTGLFENFAVLSGKGCCKISGPNKIWEKVNYNKKIYGTIYIFDVV